MGAQASGAMNNDNFRQNVERGFLPSKESITSTGLFNEYFFKTGMDSTDEVLAPSYSIARCPDPISKDNVENYISLGLNCKMDGKNHRNPNNLIVVLDISGSMGWGFNYTYSPEGNVNRKKEKTKMEIANEVLAEIVDFIRPEERLGIVLFDDKVQILQPLRKFSLIDDESLKDKISDIRERGGTNMYLGFNTAFSMLKDLITDNIEGTDKNEGYDNRIVFITDANPNAGGGKNSLLGVSKEAAKMGIYSTFIGVGLDFNSKIIEAITKVRGSNYFSVRSKKQFHKILVEDFNYIITPQCFNTLLFVESEGLEIEKIYGSPWEDESTGCLMKVETVLASAKNKLGVKGGIVLLKLKEKLTPKLNPSKKIKLTLRYEDRSGKTVQKVHEIDFASKIIELVKKKTIFQNEGIRKAILLARYTDFVKTLIDNIKNERGNNSNDNNSWFSPSNTNTNENQRVPEKFEGVSSNVKDDIKEFKKYFQDEVEVLGDKKLVKELDIIDQIMYKN